MKFTDEYVLCAEKHIWVKKKCLQMFMNGLNMALLLQACVKNIVYGMETHLLSGKEKIPGVAVCKEGYADSLLGHERTHNYWFPWNSYCQLLGQNLPYLLNDPSFYTILWKKWIEQGARGIWRCPWCSGYHRRKSTQRHEFKSGTRLIAFHIALIPLGKVWIQLFSLQLWINSRADWVLQPWWGN